MVSPTTSRPVSGHLCTLTLSPLPEEREPFSALTQKWTVRSGVEGRGRRKGPEIQREGRAVRDWSIYLTDLQHPYRSLPTFQWSRPES